MNGQAEDRTPMSSAHKAALAEGRRVGGVVKSYLDAVVERNQPARRGRKRTPESIQVRLEQIPVEFEGAESVKRLQLIQEQIDLESELAALTEGPGGISDEEFAKLEAAFINDAKAYSGRRRVEYRAWRRFGVAAAVLRAAGVEQR